MFLSYHQKVLYYRVMRYYRIVLFDPKETYYLSCGRVTFKAKHLCVRLLL